MESQKIFVAKKALLDGSRHLLNLFGKSLEEIGGEYKPEDGDTPRTLIDTNSEAAIIKIIKDSGIFREYRINAEESGKTGQGSKVLHLDPYDGTSNAQIQLRGSTMGIGISEDRKLVASIILNPFERKIYWAERGQGAYVSDLKLRKGNRLVEIPRRIRAIQTDRKSNSAKERFAWVDALFNQHTTPRKLEWIAKMQEARFFQNVRMTGSNIDYSTKLAGGQGHYQLTDAVGGFWDLCGYNLVEESGGRMVNLNGEQPNPKDHVAIAVANPADLERVLRITEQCYKDYKGFRG
jgi:fructose-1,6-bisphosphatase/inositol monophosphatase family enzyme